MSNFPKNLGLKLNHVKKNGNGYTKSIIHLFLFCYHKYVYKDELHLVHKSGILLEIFLCCQNLYISSLFHHFHHSTFIFLLVYILLANYQLDKLLHPPFWGWAAFVALEVHYCGEAPPWTLAQSWTTHSTSKVPEKCHSCLEDGGRLYILKLIRYS